MTQTPFDVVAEIWTQWADEMERVTNEFAAALRGFTLEEKMDITSIDNCYEDDGLANVQAFLMGLNIEAQQQPTDPLRRVLVAILPEFRDDGRLDRLNVLTVPMTDPGLLSDDEMTLMDSVAIIVTKLQADRAAAYAKLREPTVDTP